MNAKKLVRLIRFTPLTLLALLFVAFTGCAPELDDRLYLLDEPRLLAIRAEPAEARPGDAVHYQALIASAEGTIDETVEWAFCNKRTPLSSLGSVHPDCAQPSDPALEDFGEDAQEPDEAEGILPGLGCRIFGPEIPAPMPDEPPGRPFDPDGTSGYFQPVRAMYFVDDEPRFAFQKTRIFCGIGVGSSEDRIEFNRRYKMNTNPDLSSVKIYADELLVLERRAGEPQAEIPRVDRTSVIRVEVEWPPCPGSIDELGEDGCAGAEPFVYYDQDALEIVERREAMRVAWYSTGGVFDVDRTGRDPDEEALTSDNILRAEEAEGVVHLYAILRDERGGVGFIDASIEID